jgi:uncharacterized DUF497 family protein
MRFEWDERKRLANLAKHGLDFPTRRPGVRSSELHLSLAEAGRREMGDSRRGVRPLGRGRVDIAIRRDSRDLDEEGEA